MQETLKQIAFRTCNKAWDEIGEQSRILAICAIAVHIGYFLLNLYNSQSDSLYLRIVAIIGLLPGLVFRYRPANLIHRAIPIAFVAGIFIAGPFFMSCAVMIELMAPSTSPTALLHRQFELIAVFCLMLFLISDVKFVAGGSALCLGLVAGASIPLMGNNYLTSFLSFVPGASFWLVVFFSLVPLTRRRTIAKFERSEALFSLGSTVAHEIRTPLASIRNFARTIEKNEKSFPKADAINPKDLQVSTVAILADRIKQEAEAANLIIDMLLVSSQEQSPPAATHEQINILPTLQDALQRFPYNNKVEKSLVSITTSNDFQVRAPQIQITHVFFNLLKNGIRYAQRRSGGELKIGIDEQTRTVVFEDSGPGISEIDRKRIFDRFYTTETYGQGTGIGLSFCKQTMDSLGGSIQCESLQGQYTKFILTFP